MVQRKTKNNAYDLVCRERRFLILWSVFHLLCLTALLIGVAFGNLYMRMPDRVIVLGRDWNVYIGNSAPVESPSVLRDIALRATYGLLFRQYDQSDDLTLAMVFNRRGLRQAKSYLSDTQDFFNERQLVQEIGDYTVETQIRDGKYYALVKGVLLRRGIYFNYPYSQKRDFALMMRMEKSDSDTKLPFQVAGMRLYEEEHVDE